VRAVELVLDVLAQDRRVRIHRLEGIVDRRQRLVLDLDQLGGVGRDIAVLGDDEGDLLVLVQHLAGGEHHLDVAREGRHPVELDRLQILGRQHGDHAGHGLGLAGVDALDAGMAVGAAGEVAEQHAGQLEVVDIAAPALDEADVFLALPGAAQALKRCFAARAGFDGVRHHSAASLAPWSLVAAYWIAFTMF
jgi:hypothetical protein